MCEGRSRDQWSHTASLIAHIRASLGDKKAKVENFNPHTQKQSGGLSFKQFTRAQQKKKR